MSRVYRGVGPLENRKERRVEAVGHRVIAVGEGTPLLHPALGEDVLYQWGALQESTVRLAEALIADVRRREGPERSSGLLSDDALARALACEQIVRFPAPVYMLDESYSTASELMMRLIRETRRANAAQYTVRQDPEELDFFPDELGPLLNRSSHTSPPYSELSPRVPVRYTTAQYEAARQTGGPLFEDWTLDAGELGEWMDRRQRVYAALAARLETGLGALVVDTYGSLSREALSLVAAGWRDRVLLIGGSDEAATTAGTAPAAYPQTEYIGRHWRVNPCLRPEGLSASEYAATLAAAYLDAAGEPCDRVGGHEQMLAAMVEDGILTVVLANEAILNNSLIGEMFMPRGGLLSFAALSDEGLLDPLQTEEDQARTGTGRVEDVIGLLEYAPVSSEAEAERLEGLIEAWRNWRELPWDVKGERASLVQSSVESLTGLTSLLAGDTRDAAYPGEYPDGAADPGRLDDHCAAANRLNMNALDEVGHSDGPVIVADLSEWGYNSTEARTTAGLLLKLASQRISDSIEQASETAESAPAIVSTEPHDQAWELAGRAPGVAALDRLAETGVIDDSAAGIILLGPDA